MDLAADAREFFTSTLPARFTQEPELGKKVGAIVQVSLAEGGGDWTVDASVEPPTVRPGLHGHPRAKLLISTHAFLDALGGKRSLKLLFTQGELRVAGDPGFALGLGPLFRRR